MKAYEALRDALEREGVTAYQLAQTLGRSRYYVSNIILRKTDPKVSTLAQTLDSLGYDLVARSREDGFEFDIDS